MTNLSLFGHFQVKKKIAQDFKNVLRCKNLNRGSKMKNITRHTGKLEIVQRLESSLYGNPRYLVRIDGVTCKTQPNSVLGYGITNDEGKTVTAEIGTYYGSAHVVNYTIVK